MRGASDCREYARNWNPILVQDKFRESEIVYRIVVECNHLRTETWPPWLVSSFDSILQAKFTVVAEALERMQSAERLAAAKSANLEALGPSHPEPPLFPSLAKCQEMQSARATEAPRRSSESKRPSPFQVSTGGASRFFGKGVGGSAM